jgi:hypothetical protein
MNSLSHIAEDWPLREIVSDDPYHALWRELLHFHGRDAALRAMQSATDRTQLEKFRDAIALADLFWENFEEAGETIDPVPLYYGALWLGMAVAFTSLPADRLVNLEPSHGLTLTTGVFPQPFLNSAINVRTSGAFSNINEAFGGEEISGRVAVSDLITAIPELLDDLSRVNRETKAMQFVPRERAPLSDLEMQAFANNRSEGLIRAHFPLSVESLRDNAAVGQYLSSHGLALMSGRPGVFSWFGTRERFNEGMQICIDTPHGWFLLPTVRGKIISEFAVYLGCLYALSVFARYHPELWLRTVEDETDEHFVVRSFMLVAKVKIPELVLNHLTKRTWSFRNRP